jgi:SAM-dependent methyltransferase
MLGLPDRFDYFQCAACRCLQIFEPPADIDRFYPSGYYSYNVSKSPPFFKRVDRGVRNRLAFYSAVSPLLSPFAGSFSRQPLHAIARTGVNRESRIIDIGCGAGSLLLSLSQMGFSNLTGADPYIPQDLDHGNGVRVLKRRIDELTDTWDLVMFNHSFEHIPDPAIALKSVARILKDNGTCLIRIPTVSSYAWDHYGINWVQIDAPRHLFLHSVESMKLLAHQAGFELTEISYDSSILQFYGSEQLMQGIPYMSEQSFAINRKRSIFSAAEIREFRRKAKILNAQHRGDQAAFFLRKKG